MALVLCLVEMCDSAVINTGADFGTDAGPIAADAGAHTARWSWPMG